MATLNNNTCVLVHSYWSYNPSPSLFNFYLKNSTSIFFQYQTTQLILKYKLTGIYNFFMGCQCMERFLKTGLERAGYITGESITMLPSSVEWFSLHFLEHMYDTVRTAWELNG